MIVSPHHDVGLAAALPRGTSRLGRAALLLALTAARRPPPALPAYQAIVLAQSSHRCGPLPAPAHSTPVSLTGYAAGMSSPSPTAVDAPRALVLLRPATAVRRPVTVRARLWPGGAPLAVQVRQGPRGALQVTLPVGAAQVELAVIPPGAGAGLVAQVARVTVPAPASLRGCAPAFAPSLVSPPPTLHTDALGDG